MALWFINDHERWGSSQNIVRASTKEEALELVLGERHMKVEGDRFEVMALTDVGPSAILWSQDDSPDSPREGD